MIGRLLALIRRVWWIFLVSAALFAVLGVAHMIRWVSSEPIEVGRGPAGSPVTLSAEAGGSDGLVVYGRGEPAERYTCRSAEHDSVTVFRNYTFPVRDYGGEQWRELGTTHSSAEPGDIVFCPAEGVTEIAVVKDVPAQARLMTFVFLGAAVVCVPVALGYRLVGRLTDPTR